MAVSHPIPPPSFVFQVLLCISIVSGYVVLRRLALIGSSRRLDRESLLHEQHCPVKTFTKVTGVW